MKFLEKKNRLAVALRMALFKAFPRSVLALGQGDTPLHDAVHNGRAKVVELLLAANAPVDVQNNGGRGPQFGHDSFGFY